MHPKGADLRALRGPTVARLQLHLCLAEQAVEIE
jgi:hypothetical protein